MALVGLSILIIPALALLVVFIWALVAILSTPSATWEAAGLNQWMWLGVVVFLPLIGSVLFMAMARRQLMAAGTTDPAEHGLLR
jgi:hypothetical protein